jgi:hypothetical protein
MLGWLEWRWLGGICSPQPPKQPLGVAADDGRTGQSGAPATSPNREGSCADDRWSLCRLVAPDSPVPHRTGTVHFMVRLWRLLCPAAHCLRTVALEITFCSRPLREGVVAPLVHRTVRWHTGQSGKL